MRNFLCASPEILERRLTSECKVFEGSVIGVWLFLERRLSALIFEQRIFWHSRGLAGGFCVIAIGCVRAGRSRF